MVGLNPHPGSNPFEGLVRRRTPNPSSTGNAKLDPILKRMEEARLQAEQQKNRGQLALSTLTAPNVNPTPLPQKATPTPKHHSYSGQQVWIILCLLVWIFLTLVTLKENGMVGLLLTVPFFWGCLLLANLPKLFSFSPGRGNSNGRAV